MNSPARILVLSGLAGLFMSACTVGPTTKKFSQNLQEALLNTEAETIPENAPVEALVNEELSNTLHVIHILTMAGLMPDLDWATGVCSGRSSIGYNMMKITLDYVPGCAVSGTIIIRKRPAQVLVKVDLHSLKYLAGPLHVHADLQGDKETDTVTLEMLILNARVKVHELPILPFGEIAFNAGLNAKQVTDSFTMDSRTNLIDMAMSSGVTYLGKYDKEGDEVMSRELQNCALYDGDPKDVYAGDLFDCHSILEEPIFRESSEQHAPTEDE